MIKNLLTNWKTTSAGLGMMAGSTVHLIFAVRSGHADENTWTTAILAIIGGIGLIAAGDAAVSATKSETAAVSAKTDVVAAAVRTGDTSILTKADVANPPPKP